MHKNKFLAVALTLTTIASQTISPFAAPDSTHHNSNSQAVEIPEISNIIQGVDINEDTGMPRVKMEVPSTYHGRQNRNAIDTSMAGGSVTDPSYNSMEDGFVTEAKDQQQSQDCWIFANTSNLETAGIKAGLFSVDNADLSEAQFFNSAWDNHKETPYYNTDPLNLINGDLNEDVSDSFTNGVHAGGTDLMAYLLSASGAVPVNEDDEAPGAGYTDTALTVDKAYFVNITEKTEIKNAILENGCVTVGIHAGESQYATNNNLYTPSYVTSGTYASKIDHEVTIVGWDDDYAASNFSPAPAGNGAWIFKNSWGPDWGDNGFGYLSYYDGCMEDTMYNRALTYKVSAPKSPVREVIYQYDGTYSPIVVECNAASNVFKAQQDEKLTRVGFATQTPGTYNVVINQYNNTYETPSDGDELVRVNNVQIGNMGYYTVDIPSGREPVLRAGNMYAVTLEWAGSGTAYMCFDMSYEYLNGTARWVKCTSKVAPLECDSFLNDTKIPASVSKTVLSGETTYEGLTPRIKAYAIPYSAETSPFVSIENCNIEDIPDQTYTGDPVTPTVTVSYGNDVLEENVDYTVSYSNNTEGGQATVTITGTEDENNDRIFYGSTTVNFTITGGRIGLSDAVIAFEDGKSSYEYTGTEITPTVKVTVNGEEIEEGTDYDTEYSNNLYAGTATVTITGKGSYTGTNTKTFTITTRSISFSSIKVQDSADTGSTSYYYTGSAITPDIESTIEGHSNAHLAKNVDYALSYQNNMNPGTATVAVFPTGKTYNFDTQTLSFTIIASEARKKKINSATVSAIPDQEYTGSSITPEFTVTYGGTGLTEDVDYEAFYYNNTNVGTATVVINGIGEYTASKVVHFNIVKTDGSGTNKTDISGATVSTIPDQIYTGDEIEPSVTVTVNGQRLAEGQDYTAIYVNNTDPGTATIVLTGIGDYTGVKEVPFAITDSGQSDPPPSGAININDSKIQVAPIDAQDYTGEEITPAVEIAWYPGNIDGWIMLQEGTDYTLTYSDNVVPGTAAVHIQGKGNYTGTRTVYFQINETAYHLDIADATLSQIPDQTYTGLEIRPSVTVKYYGDALYPGTDYTVAYRNNINPGTANVTITGKGLFEGTLTGTFRIVKKDSGNESGGGGSGGGSGGNEPGGGGGSGGNESGGGSSGGNESGGGSGNNPDNGNQTPLDTAVRLADVAVNIPDMTYNGEKLCPDVTVAGLSASDYTVKYKDNVQAGTGKVTITAKSRNATGTTTRGFTINPLDISNADFSLSRTEYRYSDTAEERKPEVTGHYKGWTLIDGYEYSVTYTDNKYPGTGKAIIKGLRNFTGTKELTFRIYGEENDDGTEKLDPRGLSANGIYVHNGMVTIYGKADMSALFNKDGKPGVKYYIDNKKAAKIGKRNGKLTVKQNGKVTITAKRGSKTLGSIYANVEKLKLKKITLYEGDTENAKKQLTGVPTGATIEWDTANPDIATVSSNGMVTALSKGSTKLKATIMSGGEPVASVKGTVKVKR